MVGEIEVQFEQSSGFREALIARTTAVTTSFMGGKRLTTVTFLALTWMQDAFSHSSTHDNMVEDPFSSEEVCQP